MYRKIKQILLALFFALCFGSILSLMLVDNTSARDYGISEGNLPDPPVPFVEPAAMRLSHDNASEIPVILVLRSTRPQSVGSEDQLKQDILQYRQSVVTNLLQDFRNSRALINPLLELAEVTGDLLARNDLWIVNGMALTVSPNLFQQLSISTAVEGIYLDHYQRYLSPEDDFINRITMEQDLETQSAWGIERIRAPLVWNTFGISGTGAVVAIMDTGVDFLHPILNGNYRGNLGKGLFSHHTSWFDAINAGVYPYDDQGHGSHVAGTAVGIAKIGVAPGARWIAVKVLDTDGFGFDSWILEGFQWLLAPAGESALAPDVVNASWSSVNSTNTVFEQVVQTLTDAGILVVFAAGNEGPASGTVGSPASYRGVFAVGASDEDDDVASFSGRGPSPWREIKPQVVAPGVNILSSIPGGVFGYNTGTSMATPHVVGIAATLRAVSQTLPVLELVNIITSTARPLSTTVPNNESGWGIIDAFDAVVRLVDPAIIHGSIKDILGQGIASSSVVAQSVSEPGLLAKALADDDGNYALALNPGIYNLEASAFGLYSQQYLGVEATRGIPLSVDFSLTHQPVGEITGRIYYSNTGQLVTESISIAIAGTPLTTTSSLFGSYNIVAPQGVYTLAVHQVGYRTLEMSVTVQAEEIKIWDIYLTPSPKLLLVDEGAWYYGSQRIYWTEVLDALHYTYDMLTVKIPPKDTPSANKLMEYDIVLWSSPRGSPGLVGGAEPLQDYLADGGRLLISGQEVAYFDAGGRWDANPQDYIYTMMSVSFDGERSIDNMIQGQGPYAGLSYSIYGGDGADNQITPDIVKIKDPDIAALSWTYIGGGGAGSAVDICTPYRALYFGFGLEAIAGSTNRQEVMDRSLDWLAMEPLTTGLTINHISNPIQIGRAGTRMTHTLRLRHIGSVGNPEAVTMTSLGSIWPNEILPYSNTISPCTTINIDVVVTIPLESRIHETDWLTLTAISNQTQTSATVILETKTPAPVLLVDDDRWYPVEDRYIQALEDAGVYFDIWDNQDYLGGIPGIRSPQTETLSLYPVLIWFTGYDWYQPVIKYEMDALLDYLDNGGRLILSSQDFLDYHESDALAQRLGVQAVSEGQDIIAVQGTLHPSSGVWNSVQLGYPFPLHTDIVEPRPDAALLFRGNDGQPVAVAAPQPETLDPATLFYGFPLEALPASTRQGVLSRAVGWLSPLGQSDWDVSPITASAGDILTYVLVLRNDHAETVTVSAEHFIPEGQSLHVPSLPLDWTYIANSRLVTWQGQLTPGQVITYVWDTNLMFDLGELTYPTISLSLLEWGLEYDRFTRFYGSGSELGSSIWLSPTDLNLYPGSAVTLSFLLNNSSDYAGTVRAAVWMMKGISPVTATIVMTDTSHGWYMPWWDGSLKPFGSHTLTLPVHIWSWEGPVRIDALLSDERGGRWELPLWISVKPWRFYLPLITK